MTGRRGKRAPIRLSLCMIVRNEAEFLDGCLKSVEGAVDEIVVVDTGSDDATPAIASSHGARVVPFAWCDDFSAARNESLRHASGDWVLVLDADERLAPGSVPVLRALLDDASCGAYTLLITGEHHHSAGVSKQANSYPRLFRRLPGVRFEGNVHEQVSPSLQRNQVRTLRSNIVIHHLGYARSWAVVQEKARRNAALLQVRVASHRNDAYAWFQLGCTLSLLGKYGEAEGALGTAVRSRELQPGVRASALNLLSEISIRRREFQDAIARAEESVRLVRFQHLGYWLLAAARIGQGNEAGAVEPLRTLADGRLASSGDTSAAYDVLPERWEILYRLGVCLNATGRLDEAVRIFGQLLREQPTNVPGSAALAACIGTGNCPACAEEVLGTLDGDEVCDASLLVELARFEHRNGRLARANALLHRISALHPGHPESYLLAARWGVEAGDLAGAEGAVEEGITHGVADYGLSRIGLELALQRKDSPTALRRLGELMATVPSEREDLRGRLVALAAKLARSNPAGPEIRSFSGVEGGHTKVPA